MSRVVIVGRWLAAAAASWALARGWLLAPQDPLRELLWVLPLTVVSLYEIGRWAGHRGAERGSAVVVRAELAALAILVVAVVSRRSLGLRYADGILDPLLVAAFILLLAHSTWRLSVALRSLLGERLPRRPSVAFFLLPAVVYLSLLPWSTSQRPPNGDEPYFLLLTESLLADFDVDLSDEYSDGTDLRLMGREIKPQPGDPVGPEGQLYSRHGAFLALVLAPGYLLAGRLGALATMALLTAALVWLFLRLAERYEPERPGAAWLAWLALAFSAPLLVYSYQLWTEVPAALLMVLAVDLILGLEQQRSRRWPILLAVAAVLGLLPLLKLRFGLLAVPLLVFAWWRAPSSRRLLLLVTGVLGTAGAGLLIHQQLAFGRALRTYDWSALSLLAGRPLGVHLQGGLGMLFDCAFGLFAAGPVWLLLLPAVGLALVRSRSRLAELALLFGPYLYLLSGRIEWFGGWSPPFRYALVMLPFLALLLIPLFAGRWGPGARALGAALVLVTLVLTTLWVVFPNWTYSLADGRGQLLDHLTIRTGSDWSWLFPSWTRPRTANWMWPAAACSVTCLLWWLPGEDQRRSGWLAGGVGLLLAAALAAAAVEREPTRVAHAEDPWVVKSDGVLYPEQWTVQRIAYTGGWLLPPGARINVPVRPDGERLDLELHYQATAGLRMVVGAGGEDLARQQLAQVSEWRILELRDLDWRGAGNRLVIAVEPPGDGSLPGWLLVDRVEFKWRRR